FGVEQQTQNKYFSDSLNNSISNSTKFLTGTLAATADFFTAFILVSITMFFLLYYSSFFKEFLYKVFNDEHHEKLNIVFVKGEKVVRSYILGLFIVIAIVGTL